MMECYPSVSKSKSDILGMATDRVDTVETGLAHALMGSIAELYALIFENALIIQ